ncbi:aldotetraouronic acid ABC transporter membrane protein 2 [Paenibacillus cellulosilyticus]|uniref:Aldotetraouronic acid ABC transporter membrane protein 2 n=1 Tax=Paenibacillus cellulosilyticus TaxID=375489 RepID=A0A2V2YUM0_9BACL|nr:carbohydrate ABC transporter permease [Paenibacillus cellulosilyticus]PWV99513.1 aldotetraouronic acid ABC transporter membrane protein 2 [Paenibacillus cellulosilyticus]QKS44766.1 carbohydrate ABC transporter permease [Paenibacillus cellulosilyticus]
MANLASVSKPRKFSSRNSSLGDKIFDISIYAILTILMIVTLYPFINTLAVSFNTATDSMKGGIHLLPRQFSLENYKFVFADNSVYNATMISVLRSVIGTIVTVFASAMVAYTISRPEYVLRKFVTIAFIITMYINGGLIPNFLLIRDLGLLDSFWVYILPGVIGVFNLIIIRSFIEQLPDSILESARIDGAGDFRTFINIVLPLCLPVLATVALFSTVSQWNSWFDVFLYNSSNEHLSTLQYELQKILQNSNTTSSAESGFANSSADSNKVSPLSIRATMTIVASVPMIIIYPFLQKYFVKGMTVGGVKG